MVRNPPATAGDAGSIPGLGRSPGGGNGTPCSGDSHGQRGRKGGLWSMGLQGVGHV